MRRFIIVFIALTAICLLSSQVFAQSNNKFPPVDLPADHWAWDAVKAMMESGILEGYPGNEFMGARTLTRYEFAIAVHRVVSYAQKTGVDDAATKAMIDALEDEFSAELADIRAQVDSNAESIDELSGSLTTMGTRVDELEKRIGNIAWGGDFRFRIALSDREAADAERFRERIRLRLKFEAPIIEDTLTFKGRLATGSGGTSTNQTLDNYFRNYGFGIDRAYLEYHAPWIPWKNTLYFGRFANFLETNPAGIVWDSDLNFDGTGQHFELPAWTNPMWGKWKFNAVQGILNENNGDYIEDDEWLIGWQFATDDFLTEDLNWYASYYHFQNIVGGGNNFAADGYMGNLAGGGVDVNLDGVINNNDSIATKYNILNIGGNYTFNLNQVSEPILVHGDYVANINPDIPFGVDTRLSVDDEDHVGWLFGFRYGKAKTAGTWDFGYYYKSVGATAVVGNFADADDIGANSNAHNLYFDYSFTDNTKLQFEYIVNDLKNGFGYLADDTRQTVNLDLVVKF
ncbi:putative porin [bacterium]|nr:putative porin [bacterium]